jgi:chromosome partitioning protein
MAAGFDKRELEHAITELLLGESAIEQVLRRSEEGFDLIPGNIDLTAAEIQLMDMPARESRLKQALEPIRDNYDFIIIDCPPSLSLLTLNALAAADGIIVPMQCEYFALEGLSSLINTINALKQKLNPALEIDGIIRTMYDVRNNLANAVSNELTQHFGDTVFRTLVPRNVRLAEAPSHGMSILRYDRSSRGALAYMGLAGEVIRRNNKTKNQESA